MRGTAQRVTDHFECYKIAVTSGTPKFVAVPGVTLQDQFGSMTVNNQFGPATRRSRH